MPAVNVGGETATAIAITKIACVRVDSFLGFIVFLPVFGRG